MSFTICFLRTDESAVSDSVGSIEQGSSAAPRRAAPVHFEVAGTRRASVRQRLEDSLETEALRALGLLVLLALRLAVLVHGELDLDGLAERLGVNAGCRSDSSASAT